MHIDDPVATFLRAIIYFLADHVVAVAAAGGIGLAGYLAFVAARRRARRRWHAKGRVITVLPPTGLDPAAALAGGRRLWRDLMGIAPPRHRRILQGTPHLAVEYWLAGGEELTVRIWMPGSIAPGRVENAVRTAWPGALITHDHTAFPPGWMRAVTVTGGLVRPERGEHLPLHLPDAKEDTDPLRTLESLTQALAVGESAVVQVLARPVVGLRLRRYRATVRRLHHHGGPQASPLPRALTGVLRAVLDLLTPGPGTTPHHSAGYRRDPLITEELRAVREKATHPQWEVALRYATATTATGGSAHGRVRGLADALFAVFTVLAGRNALARHRLRHPHHVITGRQLRRGAVVSVPELAVLAHLPARTSALAAGHARGVPAPREVTGRPLTRELRRSTHQTTARKERGGEGG